MSSASPVYVKPVRQIIGNLGANTAISSGFNVSTFTQIVTLIADAVVEEVHDDQLVITDHPVEQGATIADHAYKMPARLDLTYAWSGGSPQNASQGAADPMAFLIGIYNQFLALQIGRVLCTIYTGKRQYLNMIPQAIGVTTDKENENSIIVRARFQEIIMATTQTVTIPSNAVQQLPQSTNSPVNVGTVSLVGAPALNQP